MLKSKWMCGLVAVASMALTGCSSTCDRAEDAYNDIVEKARPCSSNNETAAFNVNQCEQNIDKCTDAEQERLEKMFDCLGDMAECQPGGEQVFLSNLMGCAALGNVGETCASAFGSGQ